ncbi:MAG: sensor histidine kinase [Alkalispirochaeta sp.]
MNRVVHTETRGRARDFESRMRHRRIGGQLLLTLSPLIAVGVVASNTTIVILVSAYLQGEGYPLVLEASTVRILLTIAIVYLPVFLGGIVLLQRTFRRLVLDPIGEIAAAAYRLEPGALEALAEAPGSFEIGALTDALLGMINQIQEKNRLLHRHANRLEQAVQERTEELARSLEELTATKNALVRQEKLASLGQLAAGVAHEINNPAGFVGSNLKTLKGYGKRYADLNRHLLTFAELAREGTDTTLSAAAGNLVDKIGEYEIDYIIDDTTALIDESLSGIRRVSDIVQGLLRFARPDTEEVSSTAILDVVQEALRTLDGELSQGNTIRIMIDRDCTVIAKHGQLVQVFRNLILNAGQAMPEGGTITVNGGCTDNEVTITISDTGLGIPPDVIDRIFDPFFTTKPVGSGTGLGLAIVHGMIHSLGGSIDVESSPGTGTTFRITLPRGRELEETG